MVNTKIGINIVCKRDTDLVSEFRKAKELSLDSCQLCIWDTSLYTDSAFADKARAAIEKESFCVSSLWAGWSGPCEWNFTYGPSTIGLVPPAYREARLKELKSASVLAEKLGIKNVITHVGFIPEDMNHPDFVGTVTVLRNLCKYMLAKGQNFLFETGQETPTTLLRTIKAIGNDNIGINFDTGNLILYGKANPLDALDTIGRYVMDMHIKDGFYPTDGNMLGKEAAAGEGKANIPAVIRRLINLGYSGPFTIEREISGEQQIADIIKARELIKHTLS